MTLPELHALVRQMHGGRDTPEARCSHSRLKRDMWGKMKPEDIRDGILGVCKLRDANKISGWQPDFGLRQALRWHHEGRQLWDAAIDHERHGTPRTVPVSVSRSAPEGPLTRDVAPGTARTAPGGPTPATTRGGGLGRISVAVP